MPTKKNDLQEKVMSWFWVILFMATILYLRWLLIEMHSETNRLVEERQKFQTELKDEREESKEVFQKFYADMNKSIEASIESLNKGEILRKYLNP